MADVFLSYQRGDQHVARDVATDLEAEGFSVFFDARVQVGDSWDAVIERELEEARAVVVLWSSTARDSQWVKREAREALGRRILCPALIAQCRTPLEFSDVQAANLIGRRAGDRRHPEWRRLVGAVERCVGRKAAGAPEPTFVSSPVPFSPTGAQAQADLPSPDFTMRTAPASVYADDTSAPPTRHVVRKHDQPNGAKPAAIVGIVALVFAVGSWLWFGDPLGWRDSSPTSNLETLATVPPASEVVDTASAAPDLAPAEPAPAPRPASTSLPAPKPPAAKSATRVVVVHTLAGHSGWVSFATFSPDGSRVVTASDDRTARLWDGRTGEVLATLAGHPGAVVSAAFSPDGLRIVTASKNGDAAHGDARLWDGRTGEPLGTLAGHTWGVEGAAFSPDGSHIITEGADGTARLWDGKTGKPLATLAGHGSAVASAAFSPDSSRIVTASQNYTPRIWDAATGKVIANLAGHKDAVWSAVFSHDGSRIVTASGDSTARLWDGTGQPLATLVGHTSSVTRAVFSPDGSRVVTASLDYTARLWDGRTGEPLATLAGSTTPVTWAAFSPDGSRIITGDNTARLWDGRTGELLATLAEQRSTVRSAVFSPDGSSIVIASHDHTAKIWRIEE
jgi:WD40 repeat protein